MYGVREVAITGLLMMGSQFCLPMYDVRYTMYERLLSQGYLR